MSITIAEKKPVLLHLLKRSCPYCRSRDIRRSRRRGLMEKYVLPLILLRPYRCMQCDLRHPGLFFASRIKENLSEEQALDGPARS